MVWVDLRPSLGRSVPCWSLRALLEMRALAMAPECPLPQPLEGVPSVDESHSSTISMQLLRNRMEKTMMRSVTWVPIPRASTQLPTTIR